MEHKEQERKPYSKPVLHPIELLTGEVLDVSCKTTSGGGPDNDLPPCIVSGCLSTAGS